MIKSRILSALTRRPFLIVALISLALSLLYVNCFYSFPTTSFKDKEEVTLTGYISQISLNPDGTPKSVLIKSIVRQSRFGINKSIDTLCYVNSLSFDSLPATGSYVSVSGKIQLFKEATNYGQFDPCNYYAHKHILFSVTDAEITCLSEHYRSLLNSLCKLKYSFIKSVCAACPLESGTINTILWADKSNLPQERKDLYQNVGLAHFLVVSGLHVQALGAMIYMSLRQLNIRRSICALFSMVIIILYGMLVGPGISLIRAVIMIIVRLWGDILKKPYDMLSSMSFAMIITLIYDPFYCMDQGFIYSYLSVLAVSIYMEVIHKNKKKPMLSTIVWLFLLPASLFFSYTCSIASVFLNLLLGLLTAPMMICAFLAFVFSLHNTVIAGFFDFLFALLIRFTDSICNLINRFPIFTINGKPHIIIILVYYLVLTTFIVFWQKKASQFLERIIYLGLVLFLTSNILTSPIFSTGQNFLARPNFSTGQNFLARPDFIFRPQFTMLDIGQGDCMVLEYCPGKALIMDAGSSSQTDIARKIILPYLARRGINEISSIFLSHADSDHTNAVSDIIDFSKDYGIWIRKISISAFSFQEKDPDLMVLLKKAAQTGIPIELLGAGQKKSFQPLGGRKLSLEVLWPGMASEEDVLRAGVVSGGDGFKSKDGIKSGDAFKSEDGLRNSELCKPRTNDSNASSLVLWLSYGSIDLLLTGDSTQETENALWGLLEERLKASNDGQLEMLKVAHHGSKYSSSEQFLQALRPKYAFISAGRHNRYGHPHAETLQRLKNVDCNILRTDKSGQIIVSIGHDRVNVRTFNQ